MALTFSPSQDQKILFPDISMNGWTTFTVMCWARVNDLNKDHTIFSCGNFQGGQPLIIWRDDDSAIGSENNTFTCLATMGGTEKRAVGPDGIWNDTEWKHLVASVDTTSSTASERRVRVHVNGQLVDETSGYSQNAAINNTGSARLSIGQANGNPGGKRLDGSNEDFRVYQRFLSNAEIQTIYASNGQDTIVDGLIARATFASGITGQVPSDLKDLSPSKQTINIEGSPVFGDQFSISEKRRIRVS